MVMKWVPSALPRSNIRQTFRWLILRASLSSFENRSIVSRSAAISGFDELQGDFFLDLRVEDLIDPAHPALAELFDDLVAAGEGRAGGQFVDGRAECFGDPRGGRNSGTRYGIPGHSGFR